MATWSQSSTEGASQVALVVNNPPANARDIRDIGSIPGFLPGDREAWWVTVHRVAKSRTRLKRLRSHGGPERWYKGI